MTGNASDTSCPFCGQTDNSLETCLAQAWVECHNCNARGPASDLAQVDIGAATAEAIRLWEDGRSDQ